MAAREGEVDAATGGGARRCGAPGDDAEGRPVRRRHLNSAADATAAANAAADAASNSAADADADADTDTARRRTRRTYHPYTRELTVAYGPALSGFAAEER